ncbi:MAG: hypothetical protein SGI72_12020 [Planctomycetota bacterium]|nr:hypothetical protein [Planctomycetota bacterium]
MDTPQRTRSGGSKLGLVALACLAAIVVAALTLRWMGGRSLQKAVDRIAIEGQALTSAYLDPARTSGKADPTEWLVRVSRSRPQWDMSDISDMKKYTFILGEARANRLGEDARIAFELFDGLLQKHLEGASDEAARWNEFWVALALRLRECDGVRPWGELNEAAVRLIAVGLADQIVLAKSASQYGEIDPLRATAALDGANETFPTLPFLEEACIGDAVHVTAIHKAQAKYALEALDTLRAGLAVARIHSAPHWMMSYIAWTLQVSRVLDGLQTILPMLPRGLDLSDLEREFTDFRPRTLIAMAIRGERAFGNRVFERIADGAHLEGIGARDAQRSFFDRIKGFVGDDIDRAAYLDALTDGALRAETARFLRRPLADGVDDSFWTHAAATFAPQLEPSLHTTDLLEARLVMARAALTAYRAGAKETLEFLPQTTDPFDGKPIRCGFGDDGLVVFWSAGPNGKDDGAVPDSDDVVWGLKLPE